MDPYEHYQKRHKNNFNLLQCIFKYTFHYLLKLFLIFAFRRLTDMSETQQQLMGMNQRYEVIGERLNDRKQELQQLLSGVRTYLQDIQGLLTWLDENEANAAPAKTVPAKLDQAEKMLNQHKVPKQWFLYDYYIEYIEI